MNIAFEGVDGTGKSTSTKNSFHSDVFYSIDKATYNDLCTHKDENAGVDFAFDRIDWLTHLVYRLALPDYEWNDARVRTVFAMPDTHLVFKIHKHLEHVTDELYTKEQLLTINNTYCKFAYFLESLNQSMGYTLFKTITLIEVDRAENSFQQNLIFFSSPVQDIPKSHYGEDFTGSDLMSLLWNEERNRVDEY